MTQPTHRNSAHKAVQYALKTGKLTREPCVVCGKLKVDAHHTDYDKPLEVIWLCRKHHGKMHSAHAWLYLRYLYK